VTVSVRKETLFNNIVLVTGDIHYAVTIYITVGNLKCIAIFVFVTRLHQVAVMLVIMKPLILCVYTA
jgi:hypothetical protein